MSATFNATVNSPESPLKIPLTLQFRHHHHPNPNHQYSPIIYAIITPIIYIFSITGAYCVPSFLVSLVFSTNRNVFPTVSLSDLNHSLWPLKPYTNLDTSYPLIFILYCRTLYLTSLQEVPFLRLPRQGTGPNYCLYLVFPGLPDFRVHLSSCFGSRL